MGLALALLLVIGTTVAQIVDYEVYGLRLRSLDANTHRSIFGIASLLANLGAIAAAALLAWESRTRPPVWLATLFGLIFALRLLRPPYTLVISLPFVVAAVVVLLFLAVDAGIRGDIGVPLILSGTALLTASFVVHAVAAEALALVGAHGESWAYQVKGLLKHNAEVAGWVLVATGLVAFAVAANRPSGAPPRRDPTAKQSAAKGG